MAANNLIKVWVLVSFYDENGLHKAGSVAYVKEEEFNPNYMKKIDAPTPGGSTELSELDDVDISGVTDGEILKYDAATEKWINATGGGESGSVITNIYEDGEGHVESMEIDGTEYEFGTGETTIDLSAIETDSNGKVKLMDINRNNYEFTSVENVDTDSEGKVKSMDINSSIAEFVSIENISTQGPNGEVDAMDINGAGYNFATGGSVIENIDTQGPNGEVSQMDIDNQTYTFYTGSGIDELVDLDDVNISSPSAGQVLKYDGTSQKWVNGSAGGGGGSSLVVTLTGAYQGVTIDLATMAPNSDISVSVDSSYADIKAADDIIFKIVDTTQAGSKYTLRPTGMHTLNVSADQSLIYTFSVITPSSNTPKVFKLNIGPWGSTHTFTCVA